MKKKILELKNINKAFLRDDGSSSINILDDINIEFCEGEIVGIIGRSGCGKSTLLRLITGLIPVTSGEISLHENPINSENSKISMVFQTFGLFPWLTIFENIALGLKTKGIDEKMIKSKVSTALNLVGLRGFEEAYPREISGGMRQRVGFARAMVIDPEILILDEPFSALDYLTANILKADLLDLWFERSISSIKTIILVTHSIEEALTLCDRVIILSSNPGKVIANINVNIDHPRDHNSKNFHDILDKIYTIIAQKNITQDNEQQNNVYTLYPQSASIIKMIGFMERLKQDPYQGGTEIKEIAAKLRLTYKNVLPLIESLFLLKFIDIDGNKISLTSAGNILLDADIEAKKNIIKEHLVKYVSFIRDIYHVLQATSDQFITKKELLAMLSNNFNANEANKILGYTISWVRYAELFIYDAENSVMTLMCKAKENGNASK